MKKIAAFGFVLFAMVSCDQFKYSPYQIDRNSKYKELNEKNIALINPSRKDTTRVIVLGDTQRFYKSSQDLIEKINKLPDDAVDFVVHTGDLVDFGIQKEYYGIHEVLNQMKFPYVAVVGNHDMIGNGAAIYENMYGEFDFSFIVNGNKFIYINTNSREHHFDDEHPNISWLDSELADTANYNQAIIVSHVAPHHSDFNPELEEEYVETLERYGTTLLYINGHHHDYYYDDVYNNGIMFLNTFSTSHEKTVLVEIWDGGFKHTIID